MQTKVGDMLQLTGCFTEEYCLRGLTVNQIAKELGFPNGWCLTDHYLFLYCETYSPPSGWCPTDHPHTTPILLAIYQPPISSYSHLTLIVLQKLEFILLN